MPRAESPLPAARPPDIRSRAARSPAARSRAARCNSRSPTGSLGKKTSGPPGPDVLSLKLKPVRMTRLKSARRAQRQLPAGCVAIAPSVPGRGIESQAGDDGEGMTIAGVDRDPFSLAAVAKTSQLVGTERGPEQARGSQRIGNRSGTIVAEVEKRRMAAAPAIRLGAQLVGRPDRAFYRQRRLRR